MNIENLADFIVADNYTKFASFVNNGIAPAKGLPKINTGNQFKPITLPKTPTTSTPKSSWSPIAVSPLTNAKPTMPKLAGLGNILTAVAVNKIVQDKPKDQHDTTPHVTSKDPETQKMLENERVKAYINNIIK